MIFVPDAWGAASGAPFCAHWSSDPSLVHLDRKRGADAIAVGTHHGSP